MRNEPLSGVPLLMPAVCLMAGIVAGEWLSPVVPWWPVFAGMVVLALLLWKYPLGQSVAICACVAVLGVVLLQRQMQSLRVTWPSGRVAFEAVVLTEPVEKPRTMAVDVLLTANGRKLRCYLHKDRRSRSLRVGDGLSICSRIRANSSWRRGTFDYRRYLEIHGFTGSAYVKGWDWRKRQVSLRALSWTDRSRLRFLVWRSLLLQRLRLHGLSDDVYGVVAAMALGDKSALSQDMKDVYARTGAAHVLALSGLHLGIIYMLLSLLVVGRRWRMLSQLLVVSVVWAFVFLVGMPVSIVRSAVMISIYALLALGRRDRMSVNTLAFTAIVMLVASPCSLFDVSFQLSFTAVLAILLLMPLLEGLLPERFLMRHRIVGWAIGMAGVSCAAQLGTAPLTAYYFGRLPLYFLLTNFIVIPATTLILCLSLAVMVLPGLAYLLIYIVGLLNAVLLSVSRLPGASVSGLHPSVLQTWLWYLVIVAAYLLAVRLTCIRASARCRSGLPPP